MAARPLVAFISLLLVLCFLPGIDATHFAYATMRWNMTSQTTNAAATGTTIAFTQTFDYKMEAAFRWSFFSNPPIGQYANTGANVNFVPMDNPQPAAASVGGYKSLVVNLLVVQTNPPDDWFYGYVIGAPLLQQTATYRATNPTPPNYRIYYTNCCRISTLKDQNNDRDWTITGILNTKTLRSPITTGTPRVWLALNVPSIYFIPYVSQANLPVTFFLSNPTDSTLLNVQPSAFGPFTFDKVIGKVSWTPNQVGLYAIQFMIEEICAAAFPTQTQCRLADNVTPTDNGGSAGTVATRNNCCARIPLDFIFQIVVLCTSQITTNCFNPPYFYSPFDPRISPDPTKWVINFYRNVQGTFLLCATHNDSTQLVEISLPPLPPGAVMNGVKLNSANRGRPACYEYLWTPTINDVDQNLCFYATAFPSQAKSIGQYCLLLKIIDAPGFVITGIIRDFHIYHANFNRTAADWYSDPRFAPNTLARPNWVKIKLGSDYKPEWNSAATPVPTTVGNSGFGLPGNTNEGWYDWWHTDDPTLTTPGRPRNLQQIQSTTLTSGTNPNPFIFSYISSAFYPIDNRLFGNEGQAHNCHYTYEVNTYLSYVSAAASSNGQGLVFTFNMDDDFWLFVDSVLPKNWNLYGIRPLIAGKSSGVDYTLNMDDFVTNWAPVAIPGDPHTIVSGETVRLDFFYANRRGDGSPVFNISLTNFTLCDGLSSGVEIFNWPQFSDNQAVGQPKPSTSLVFYPSLGGGAGAAFATNCNGTNTCLQLSRSDRTNSISSVWYTNGKANGAGQVNPTPLLLTHGFRLEGSFQVNGAAVGAGAEGFAIVMVASDASPASGAGAGFNLGYGGALSKSLAVEFDFIQSSAANDPVGFNASYWAQISVHTRTTKNANGDYDLNSADENIGAVPRSFGGSSDTTLPLNFKNGTAHYFKIEYQPAKFDPTNPNLRGVIRVWIGRFVAPAVEAFIDQNAFNAMIGGAAYLGFTTGSGDGAANLMITWAKLLVVPTSPAQTTAIAPPFTIVAGDTGYVTIQAKDACGDLILTGGELSSFLAQYQPVLCTTPFVNATGVDNNNGSYTFYYNPVIKGLYTFPITFNGQPILNSPFPFTVVAAPVDPPSTFAIFSQPPNKYSNLAGDSGIACSRYNSLGGFLGFSQFDVSAAGDVFGTGKAGGMQTWLGLVAATDYVACALSGDTLAIAQRNIVAPTITAKWPAATKFGTLPVANSWALVAQGSRVSEVTNTNRVSMAQLSGIDASSISFTRAFNVTAESATSFCGPYARVKCVFNDTRVPAATPNQLGIEGHDRFGNLNDENVYTAFFSPDITDPSAGGYHTYNVGDSAGGFHVFDYGNPRAGEYFYYVKVNGVNIRGSQYKVVFTPGLANITTSSVSADAGVETAGTNASFITSLFDANKNPIQFQNPLDVVTAVVKLDGNVLYTVTLTWTDGSVGGVPCQKCILVGSYFPTLATTRAVLEFTINGATAVYSPVTINPGPLSAPDSNCTFEASPSALPPAGLPTSLIIQAKDRFRNLRVTPNQPGDVFYISYNPAVLASSTIGAVNLYLGIGQYQALFTPTKKGPQQTTVVVNATGAGDVPAGTPQVCQTQINILPGAPDKSTTANVFTSMTAGVEQAFTMQSFDPFGNLRDNTVAGVQVAFPDDYLYRFYSPYDDRRPEGTYTKDANTAAGTFTVRLNTTVAATYLLEVRTNPATKFSIAYPSTALINSPWTIVVKPGPTYPPNTVFTSATGSYGGFPGNQSWFQITANDIYMNQQIDFSDKTKFTVQVFNIDNGAQFGANLTLINLAVNGTYNVTYTIPPNPTSTPKLFWIKVCHPGAPAYAAWCKNLTGIALQDTGLSYATIAVAPGRAGYLSNFTIDNHDNANTPVLTTTSFSVVLSRISDGVQITPITVTCRMPLLADGTCPATSSGRVYFDATFTPTQNIGDFKVRVFAYGIVETEQSKSPGVTVTIGPGDVSPPNSKVLGLPVTIQAGTSAKFQALLADAWNHNITGSSPKTVTANLTSPDQMLIQLTTAQTNPAGAAGVLYEFDTTTQLTKAGVWTVQVYETVSFASTTRVLAVSTFRITVTPGPADRLTSYVVLPALSSDGSLTTAGQSVTLSVYPLDSYGNSVTDPSTSFTYNDPLNPNATTFTSTPSIDGNGVVSFKVQYTPYKIANPLNNTINVNLGGNPVTGTGAGVGTASPIKVLVNPASVSATYSKVRCYQTTAIAGNSVSCAVDPRDIYDNLWYVNRPDAIQASIKGRASSAVGATVVSQGNGSYVFTVDGATGATTTASQWTGSNYAADYTWSLNAEAVSLAVPALSVENGVAAGAQSVHQDLTPIRVGALRAYSVITYDQFGNRCYLRSGSDSFVFKFLIGTIDCGEQEVPPVDATGNFSIAPATYWKDGQYNYTLSGRVVGKYTLNFTTNGTPLDCIQKFVQIVTPGFPCPPNSTYIIDKISVQAGTPIRLDVQVNDCARNAIGTGGTPIAIGNSVSGTPLLWTQIDYLSTLVAGFTAPDITRPLTLPVVQLQSRHNLLATYKTPPQPTATLRDYGTSAYTFTITPFKAGDFAVVVSFQNETNQWVAVPATPANWPSMNTDLHVLAGPPRQFAEYQPPIFTPPITAAVPTSFKLQALDQYGNVNTTNFHTYKVQLVALSNGQGYTVPITISPGTNGSNTFNLMSAWHGSFSLKITMTPNDGSPDVVGDTVLLNVSHATCAYDNPSKPYRCPDGSCVAAYSQCPGIASGDASCTGVYCKLTGGSLGCAANVQSCACDPGTTMCPDGHCAASCPPFQDACPVGYVQCKVNGVATGACRKTEGDCPSVGTCPPGYVVCANGLSCSQSLAACPVMPTCSSGAQCPSGLCVTTMADCPTQPSCGAGKVLCLTDFSCQTDRSKCPQQYECYSPTAYRCPGGSCRNSSAQCPSLTTCPLNWVKCEGTRCAETLSGCPDITNQTCALNQTRCPLDGACTNNLLFCASKQTCPPSRKVQCYDGSCASSVLNCPQATTQSASCGTYLGITLVNCPDGSCAKTLAQCPTGATCPDASPVMCGDGSCVVDSIKCPILPDCPPDAPVRCSDGLSCRGSLPDCPTIPSCTAGSIKCSDGTCALAQDTCVPAAECKNGTVRCSGGECVVAYALCPTHVTCSIGFSKCSDGTCQESCPYRPSVCQANEVVCPQAAAGVQCEKSLDACPPSFVCPSGLRIRCSDSSCAVTVANCPSNLQPPPADKFPCADGTWASSLDSCPTPITCPSTSPFKCFDNTCRKNTDDCPPPVSCTGGKFRCSNGACVDPPWDTACIVSSAKCADATPYQCLNSTCVKYATDCDASDPLESGTGSVCPKGFIQCQAGNCVKPASADTDCAVATCPTSLPVICSSGLCVKDGGLCPQANGCPASAPLSCTFTGACMTQAQISNGDCKSTVPPCPRNTSLSTQTVKCDLDGSCAASQAECPLNNGCPGNTPIRCLDKSCAKSGAIGDAGTCTDPVSNHNRCPTATPYACEDGFCATSFTTCPYQTATTTCGSSTPFRCADGVCVSSSVQCSLVVPCNFTLVSTADGMKPKEQRCGDGTCRAYGTCPLVNLCAPGVRCDSGLCAADTLSCNLNYTSGCLATQFKCASGECAADAPSCSQLPSPSGCPAATPNKCFDGSCKAVATDCNYANGCPAGLEIRCNNDGSCQDTVQKCNGRPACTKTICPDGSCNDKSNCTSFNGCPVSTPVRCADGSCAQNEAGVANGCPLTVICNSGQFLCADGKCRATSALCPAVAPCPAGQTRCGFDCSANCTSGGATQCPPGTPILCKNGGCVGNAAQCASATGGPKNQLCVTTDKTVIQCQDGSCGTATACIKGSNDARSNGNTPQETAEASSGCPANYAMCPNGLCVPQFQTYRCGIIPRCPKGQNRCDNGTCAVTCGAKLRACSAGNRCEDGWCRNLCLSKYGDGSCRSVCLPYDGCGLAYPFHCGNRECAKDAGGCQAAAQRPQMFYRRLLQKTNVVVSSLTPCIADDCLSSLKAQQSEVTVDITANTNVDIVFNSGLTPVLTLGIPSGTFVLKSNGTTTTTLSIRAVAESDMRYAINEVHASRRFSYGSFLPFSSTVLSAAFSCVTSADVDHFNVPITVTAWIDLAIFGASLSKKPTADQYGDVCLAYLYELPGFKAWRCVVDNATARSEGGLSYAHPEELTSYQYVRAALESCKPETIGGIQQLGDGVPYAFILAPRTQNPEEPAGLDVVQRNIVWIILGVLLGIAALVLLAYCAFRLFRYRGKYHKERDEADRLQEEVDNMKQFGGEAGNKDDAVAMTSNPLSVQLKDVQKQYDAEELKLKQAENELRQQEGEIRQEHIAGMRDNRDKLAEELERLKKQLQEQQASGGPKATFHDDDTSTDAPGGDVVREDISAPTSKPKRKNI